MEKTENTITVQVCESERVINLKVVSAQDNNTIVGQRTIFTPNIEFLSGRLTILNPNFYTKGPELYEWIKNKELYTVESKI